MIPAMDTKRYQSAGSEIMGDDEGVSIVFES
jgi:hypothetical protein